jgi:two-component system NarL family sensor kinase
MLDTRSGSTAAGSPLVDELAERLAAAIQSERRADCMSRIQSDVVQLALDLLVSETDIEGFFRGFIKSVVEECESRACGVWLLDEHGRCEPWMAYVDGRFHDREAAAWDATALPRAAMAEHLRAYTAGWNTTVEYFAGDERLPENVRAFNEANGIAAVQVAPLALPTHNLGWIALASADGSSCETTWRRAVLEATAKQATLSLHQHRLAEQSRREARRQAALEERNRLARDIHDTLTQGFAAILMQLQAAQRESETVPPAIASKLETAVHLARSHMIEARRSVSALRPIVGDGEDLGVAFKRLTDMARRTSEVPIELELDELPRYGDHVEREIVGIAQEALTNAVRHSKARQITVRASSVRSIGFRLSVADDGRGIARELRAGGFGMTSMQERADRIGASLTVVTAPRLGTEVVLAWQPSSVPAEVHVIAS